MILIFPWARMLPDGKPSPKNYPWWNEVVAGLMKVPMLGTGILQVSQKNEPGIPGASRTDDVPIRDIERMLSTCETWISVDSFVPHLAHTIGQPGVVLFGPSDPLIFGHAEHINLQAGRQHLREWQFRHWSQVDPNPAAFVAPGLVIQAVQASIRQRQARI